MDRERRGLAAGAERLAQVPAPSVDVPVLEVFASIQGEGRLEGGDVAWVTPGCLAVGRSSRTNREFVAMSHYSRKRRSHQPAQAGPMEYVDPRTATTPGHECPEVAAWINRDGLTPKGLYSISLKY